MLSRIAVRNRRKICGWPRTCRHQAKECEDQMQSSREDALGYFVRALVAVLLLAIVGPSLAAEIAVMDGDTFQLDNTIYRLEGIDAPEIDQTCLDQSGEVWPCGVTVRDRLSAHIGKRAVRCEDKGPDRVYKHRRIGICSIESEATTLNEWLVREGWAIKSESSAKGRFAAEEADASENRRGLWSGCFAEPRDLPGWNHNGARLFGGSSWP
jgi:endonuclease YncB( thermonuclease family)